MSPSDVALLLIGVASLGAVAEWRLHHNRSAIVSDLKIAMMDVAKAAVVDAVTQALKDERVNGAAIDELSEHVGMLDDRLGKVEGILKGARMFPDETKDGG